MIGKIVEFTSVGDSDGMLTYCENRKSVRGGAKRSLHGIPFEVKRVFYIYGTADDVIRGKHANRLTDFVLVAVVGNVTVKLIDVNGNETVYLLDKPDIGVYIPHMVWKEMYSFSKDAVLVCLASELYQSEEYIRDYDDFLSCKG